MKKLFTYILTEIDWDLDIRTAEFYFTFDFRLPIVDEKAPRDQDFDAILTEMLNTTRDTACIFNCQVGTLHKYEKV